MIFDMTVIFLNTETEKTSCHELCCVYIQWTYLNYSSLDTSKTKPETGYQTVNP